MSLKMEFVEKAQQPGARMSRLCGQYGISRETGYKWLRRYKREGPDGLEERSRRPKTSPLATAEDIVVAVLEERERHPRRGPKKLRVMLERKLGEQTPSVATIARVLNRFGKVRQRSRFPRRISIVDTAPRVSATRCNEVWTVDFKGWWRTRDGERCEPLTVRDAFSRYVLTVKLIKGATTAAVRKVFEELFRRYGVPEAIQCDNGVPFVNVKARGGLTQLSAWWVSLGIKVIRSRPGCPQDNGGHERMHRDVKADLQACPAGSRAAQQRACDRWRQEFNHVRPHEALGDKVPADLYQVSQRRARKTTHLYPPSWFVRTVTTDGAIYIKRVQVKPGRALAGQQVALEPLGGLQHRLWYRDLDLGLVELAPDDLLIDTGCEFYMAARNRKQTTTTTRRPVSRLSTTKVSAMS